MSIKIFAYVSVCLLFGSCIVSKNKYEAVVLERDLLSSDLSDASTQNKMLSKNLDQTIEEFEQVKFDFSQSTAMKTDTLSAMMIQVSRLSDEQVTLNATLKETIARFKDKEKSSFATTEELESTLTKLSVLQRDNSGLEFSLKQAQERNELMQKDLKEKQGQAMINANKFLAAERTIENQGAQLKEMELKMIKNQQNIEEISSAFIELRKEMLSAKSNNKTLDPNKSKNVNRIAKLLGHY